MTAANVRAGKADSLRAELCRSEMAAHGLLWVHLEAVAREVVAADQTSSPAALQRLRETLELMDSLHREAAKAWSNLGKEAVH